MESTHRNSCDSRSQAEIEIHCEWNSERGWTSEGLLTCRIILGEAGINIATFHVGREAAGGNAVALIEIDGELPNEVLAKVRALPQVQQAKPLKF